MERTESRIVQVAPAHENGMIEEMQRFGWNLQGRQEMSVEGDTSPDLATTLGLSGNTQTYVTKIKHYVKLHFARNLNIPNLERVKQIESEYHNLSSPSDSGPEFRKLAGSLLRKEAQYLPGGLLAGAVLALIIGVATEQEALMIVGFILLLSSAGLFYHVSREPAKEAKRKITSIREESARRAQELLAELKSLGYG